MKLELDDNVKEIGQWLIVGAVAVFALFAMKSCQFDSWQSCLGEKQQIDQENKTMRSLLGTKQ